MHKRKRSPTQEEQQQNKRARYENKNCMLFRYYFKKNSSKVPLQVQILDSFNEKSNTTPAQFATLLQLPSVGQSLVEGMPEKYDADATREQDLLQAKTALLSMAEKHWSNDMHFVSARNNIIKIMAGVHFYNDEWKIRMQRVNNLIFLDIVHVPSDHVMQNAAPLYMGNYFETVCCGEKKDNTCVFVRSTIGKHNLLLAAEIDCMDTNHKVLPAESVEQTGTPYDLMLEMKLTKEIASPKEQEKFDRYKVPKFYIQSVLGGVKHVLLGFRTEEGKFVNHKLVPVQDYYTPQFDSSLEYCDALLHFLRTHVLPGKSYELRKIARQRDLELHECETASVLTAEQVQMWLQKINPL